MSATLAPADLIPLLQRIHDSRVQLVLEFTGAGAAALAWLHSLGGSSRTVLEASDRYAPGSLIDTIGFTPTRFTSAEASLALAQAARARARFLAAPATPVVGVGASATIATDRLKRGEHRAVVALAGPLGEHLFELVLDKGARERAEEEELVSRLILSAIADGSGLLERPQLGLLPGDELQESFSVAGQASDFAAGRVPALLLNADLSVTAAPDTDTAESGLLILSGSFNPLHHGHRSLAAAAAQHTGRNVTFELSLINADKPESPLAQIQRRAVQFGGLGPLLLTRAPLFLDKARLFPGSTFVIGADTATRLLDPRFYPDDRGVQQVFGELDRLGAHFLVAGRKRGDGFATMADLDIPRDLEHLFSDLPDFRQDISSTELRERRGD